MAARSSAGGRRFAVQRGHRHRPARRRGRLLRRPVDRFLRRPCCARRSPTAASTCPSSPPSSGRRTLAFVKLENGDARYAFFDENSAGRMLTDADLPAFPKTVTALHFGSFSLASEPFGSALEALMKREQKDRVDLARSQYPPDARAQPRRLSRPPRPAGGDGRHRPAERRGPRLDRPGADLRDRSAAAGSTSAPRW